MLKKTRKIVPIPRQPLTKKAKAAILTYAQIKTLRNPNLYFAVEATLEADRMRREKLYQWLESKGYRWSGNLWYSKDAD
ncbi:hypothetical protein I8748_31910 [Nostoc sp. CENA67]|uniref:Uncharacterized protein n=1 Tax=Amazonocrinis nigriterrae CENA67 TaxID=2794033 RepID=A0A8J7HZY4_9NOST|nr:hypothetical protein [Amazonocrinis nigriterrae]MBH8566705.1 hypothetical protein [Amazonocrinis nigriterrae CENA67]